MVRAESREQRAESREQRAESRAEKRGRAARDKLSTYVVVVVLSARLVEVFDPAVGERSDMGCGTCMGKKKRILVNGP